MAGLDEEADLPLEQLLARYGNYHLAAGGDGGSDADMPDALPVAVKREAAVAGGDEEEGEGGGIQGEDSQERMGNAIAAMAELQPAGTTLDTAHIKTKARGGAWVACARVCAGTCVYAHGR